MRSKNSPCQLKKIYEESFIGCLKITPYFISFDCFQKDFEYYTAILTEHIKKLEGKIALKPNGIKSKRMIAGVVASVLSAVSGYGVYYLYGMNKMAKALDPEELNHFYRMAMSQETTNAALACGFISIMFATIAADQFHKVYRYAERLADRLERDKKLVAILEQEKVALDRKKMSNLLLKR